MNLEEHYRKVYDPQSPGYLAMVDALTTLRRYCKQKGIRTYLAMTPDVHNLKDYKFGYIHQILAKLSKNLGFSFVDLYPGLSGLVPEEIWSMPGDPHPNALGHRKMAQQLFPILHAF